MKGKLQPQFKVNSIFWSPHRLLAVFLIINEPFSLFTIRFILINFLKSKNSKLMNFYISLRIGAVFIVLKCFLVMNIFRTKNFCLKASH